MDWVYSVPKYEKLKQKSMDKGKTEVAANRKKGRRTKSKFRSNHNDDKILI